MHKQASQFCTGAATMPVRILIADDHEVVRRGLRAMLETVADWSVCGEATTGEDAVQQAKELAPDIIVMDITMPESNGLDATRKIREILPQAEVLVLTMHDSEQILREVFDAGARGYLLKSDAGQDLVRAIEALLDHRVFISSRATELVLDRYLKKSPPQDADEPATRLTSREREIIQLLAEGRSNKEVANALNISVKTAETHRTNIMNKLGLHSVSELVRFAVRNKLIEP
jgi:DNA-binding NarL/FixJ family response regulator